VLEPRIGDKNQILGEPPTPDSAKSALSSFLLENALAEGTT